MEDSLQKSTKIHEIHIPQKYFSSESLYEDSEGIRSKVSKPTIGRQKIIKKEKYSTKFTAADEKLRIPKLNQTDAEILNMIKQINDSAETTTPNPYTKARTTTPTEEADEYSQVQVRKQIITKHSYIPAPVWPTDFMPQNTSIHDQSSGNQNNSPSDILSNLNILVHNSLLPQLPLNISKVGKPYKQQNNYTDEPSICVPITVREKAYSDIDDILEIERVYCFPLPFETTVSNAIAAEVRTLDEFKAAEAIKRDEINLALDNIKCRNNLARIVITLICSFAMQRSLNRR